MKRRQPADRPGEGDEAAAPAPRKKAASGPAKKAKARKAAAPTARRRAARPSPPPVPDPTFAVAFHELGRDALSIFLYVALLPEETVELVKALDLSLPGFRRESLDDVQRCDLLADHVRAVPKDGALVVEALRKGWERPVLSRWPLARDAALDLLDACHGEGALPLALWRVLCDPQPEVRGEALPFLEALATRYYGPPPADGAPAQRPAAAPEHDAQRRAQQLEGQLEDARRKLEMAEARAESVRRKGEEAREKLQSWLKEARAREARAVDEAARAREAKESAERDLASARADLAAARAQDAAVELQRLRGASRDLEARVGSLEGRLERARERERELEAEAARLRAAPAEAPIAAQAGAEPGDAEVEDAPASWLMPIYTREFYDSLQGWDRRVQRAAFKQAALLAQDHRHPSLRALALEGLPGYFRVRVATDVRLLYRRTERQNTVEILSLIDREDLDRYIKQAKTRT